MKTVCILMVAFIFAGCANDGSTPGQKLDTLLNKADTTAERIGDSVKTGARELKEEVKEEINDVLDRDRKVVISRDSINKDSIK